MTSNIEELKSKFEQEVEKMRQLEKGIDNRRQLESQLTENNMVKEELDRLESDANVYKLIGPVLVKQDLSEAKQNVQKRIDYINTEINRVESLMADFTKKMQSQKEVLNSFRGKFSVNSQEGRTPVL